MSDAATASASLVHATYIPLWMYVVLSVFYLITMQLALQIRTQFNRFFLYGAFIAGGIIGYFFNNYLLGFIVGIVTTLILW